MYLRCREAGTSGIGESIDHVSDQLANFRRLGVSDRFGDSHQHRMPHAGDFENSHKAHYGALLPPGKLGKNRHYRPSQTAPRMV